MAKDAFKVGQIVEATNGFKYRVTAKGGKCPWAKRYSMWEVKDINTHRPDQFSTADLKLVTK